MLCNIFFFTGLLWMPVQVWAMNIEQNYALVLEGSRQLNCCFFEEECGRELPYFLPGEKHNKFLHESLYDQFKKEKFFAMSMTKQQRLPLEVGDVIVAKGWILENQCRDRDSEKILEESYSIFYKDLCFLTKAQKQLLFYCIKSALYHNGILKIEGRDKEFSKEMLKRFYSLPTIIQKKLSHHNNGNSLYVKTKDPSFSLSTKLFGQDFIVREKNIKKLAKIAGTMTTVIFALIAVGMVVKEPEQIFMPGAHALSIQLNRIKIAEQRGSIIEQAVMWSGVMPIVMMFYMPLIAMPMAMLASGCVIYKCILNSLLQTTPEAMSSQGFEEVFVFSDDDSD